MGRITTPAELRRARASSINRTFQEISEGAISSVFVLKVVILLSRWSCTALSDPRIFEVAFRRGPPWSRQAVEIAVTESRKPWYRRL